MKLNMILKAAVRAFVGGGLDGKDADARRGALDRGVLTVGMLVAALDGAILNEEYEALTDLAKRCCGGEEEDVRRLFDRTLPEAGRLMAMAQIVVYSDDDRLKAFLAAARKALPSGFSRKSASDLRRAFALWVLIGVADGKFSEFEKKAVSTLAWYLATERKAAAPIINEAFLDRAEDIAHDLAVPARRASAEASLKALMAGE